MLIIADFHDVVEYKKKLSVKTYFSYLCVHLTKNSELCTEK